MANIQSGGGDSKRGKPTRINLRVDFTPMVDMNMLLLTFFMLCSTLSKPQIMDIAMPTNDDQIKEEEMDKVPESKTITLLLGKDNKVFYYSGKPNYEDYTTLKETTFAPTGGVRDILLDRNREAVTKMIDLKRERRDNKKMPEEEFKKRASEIKNDKESTIVVIKATDESVYEDLVDALDEMAICSIGKYAIVKFDEASDGYLIKNLETKGAHGQEFEHGKS